MGLSGIEAVDRFVPDRAAPGLQQDATVNVSLRFPREHTGFTSDGISPAVVREGWPPPSRRRIIQPAPPCLGHRALLETGPTLTNVMDLRVVIVG